MNMKKRKLRFTRLKIKNQEESTLQAITKTKITITHLKKATTNQKIERETIKMINICVKRTTK
jgi:hypothetical protein